jgi:hypothetical protein
VSKINELTQSPQEFREYFTDVFNSHVRTTFDKDDVLMFITYTPCELTLNHKEVSDKTAELFNGFKYIEVLEQNFKTNKVYNYSEYIDGFHSHILIRESDYKLIKSKLKNYDILAKLVYDLNNLINVYLRKQAGATNNRLLPTKHIPLPESEPISNRSEKTSIEAIPERFILLVVDVIRIVSYVLRTQKNNERINKIRRNNMFVNDT